MRSPVVIKQSPLTLIRRIVEVEIIISILLFIASFLTNYEHLYQSLIIGRLLRYDIFLFVGASVIQLVVTVLVFFVWQAEEYRIKEKEIIHRRGFFGSKERSIMLRNITEVEYKRSPLEFLLGYGTIILRTNGGNKEFPIRSIDQAEIYANIIKEAVDAALGRPQLEKKRLQVLDLILEGEHSKLEFKQTFRWDGKRNISNKDLEKAVMKTIAAFLNSSGGIILIGVTDRGMIHGMEEDYNSLIRKDRDGFENHFNQTLRHMIGAEFRQYVNIIFERIDERDVCVVLASPAPKPVYLKVNDTEEFFIRTGNTTSPLKISEVNSYIATKWG